MVHYLCPFSFDDKFLSVLGYHAFSLARSATHTSLPAPMPTHSLGSAQVSPTPGSLPYLSLCFHRILYINSITVLTTLCFICFCVCLPWVTLTSVPISLWCYAWNGACSLNILLSNYVYNHPAHTSHPLFIVLVCDPRTAKAAKGSCFWP